MFNFTMFRQLMAIFLCRIIGSRGSVPVYAPLVVYLRHDILGKRKTFFSVGSIRVISRHFTICQEAFPRVLTEDCITNKVTILSRFHYHAVYIGFLLSTHSTSQLCAEDITLKEPYNFNKKETYFKNNQQIVLKSVDLTQAFKFALSISVLNFHSRATFSALCQSHLDFPTILASLPAVD